MTKKESKNLIKAAEQGDEVAQYNLGVMYYLGDGIKQDYEKAFYWFQKAAEQNYAPAQYNLSVMYKNGEGIKQDYEKAFYWYKKSQELMKNKE